VATITERAKEETIEIAPRQPSLVSAMYILVDAETASAAELFARHFRRTAPAVVIGDRTAGRVNAARIYSERIGVDTIVPFAISVTVGQIRLPDNRILEGVGVMPDKLCLPTAADLREEKDPCLDLALSLAREKLGIKPPNY
jgi:C-terminal processing protease CtpA/Prc